MPDPGVRVALLAHVAGTRKQLRRALTEHGAEVVAEGDPAELDPGTVAGRQPGVVVVSLEPAIEDALAEFDDLLAMPGVQVIYDDAEVTGQLDGWDLARWARHLASKLAGSDAVLPPAPADAEPMAEAVEAAPDIQPGAPPTPAQEMDHHKLEDYAAESVDLSAWVPTTPSLTDVPVEPTGEAAGAGSPDAGLDLELDLDLAGLEQAMATPIADPAPETAPAPHDEDAAESEAVTLATEGAAADDGAGAADFADGDLADFLDLSVTEAFEAEAAATDAATAADAGDAPLLVDFEIPDGPVNFSSFSSDDDTHALGVDDDVAALAAQLDAYEAGTREEVREPDFSRATGDEPLAFDEPLQLDGAADGAGLSLEDPASPDASAAAAAPQAPVFSGDFGNLELAPMDAGAPMTEAPARPAPPPDEPVKISFGTLSLVDDETLPAASPASSAAPAASPAPAPVSSLSLEGDDGSTVGVSPFGTAATAAPAPAAAATTAARRGALFVIAGLGGPDGVRQLLAALPADLPVPVLLYQHLDTGKHDRLVGQLAKASRLPLELAVTGRKAVAGHVSVLPPGVGVQSSGDGFDFVPDATLATIVAALPAADSAVLVLSGGDPGVVPAVQAMQSAGGRVFAQDPASCFDAGAAQALIEAGAATAPVPGLARLISECWS